MAGSTNQLLAPLLGEKTSKPNSPVGASFAANSSSKKTPSDRRWVGSVITISCTAWAGVVKKVFERSKSVRRVKTFLTALISQTLQLICAHRGRQACLQSHQLETRQHHQPLLPAALICRQLQ